METKFSRIEASPNQNEVLDHPIRVFRSMSSEEFNDFINGKNLTPLEKSEPEQTRLTQISTTTQPAIWFSPDRIEEYDHPDGNTALVSEDLPLEDFLGITRPERRYGFHKRQKTKPSTPVTKSVL